MFLVDTNVLLDAVNRSSPFHKSCREKLEDWRHSLETWYVSWPVLFEFMRVSTHRKVLPSPMSLIDSWAFVEALLAAPGLTVLVPGSRHAVVADEVIAEHPDLGANKLHDAAIAILMREHGIRRIVTRDSDFHRFPFLQVIDPTHV